MLPVDFPEANYTLGAPQGMDNCLPLPVFRDGTNCVSCWQLTDEEVELLLVTRRIYIGVVSGKTQPPIFATTIPPFSYPPSEQ
ncbi:hypothetical protein [Tellurirhabdus bombi]|uniref:hypothetical protein n=1 Tax=Tellurirhabdus bombi TaxID=2907205 RepID=UPI001F30205A|nr:hypothetical protein [Tellurirhabdus bombi]